MELIKCFLLFNVNKIICILSKIQFFAILNFKKPNILFHYLKKRGRGEVDDMEKEREEENFKLTKIYSVFYKTIGN